MKLNLAALVVVILAHSSMGCSPRSDQGAATLGDRQSDGAMSVTLEQIDQTILRISLHNASTGPIEYLMLNDAPEFEVILTGDGSTQPALRLREQDAMKRSAAYARSSKVVQPDKTDYYLFSLFDCVPSDGRRDWSLHQRIENGESFRVSVRTDRNVGEGHFDSEPITLWHSLKAATK